MSKKKTIKIFLIIFFVLFYSIKSQAEDINDNFSINVDASIGTFLNQEGIIEDNESKRIENSWGFNLYNSRISFISKIDDDFILLKVMTRVTPKFEFMDGFVQFNFTDYFRLYIGQFKIPSVYELTNIGATTIDFIARSVMTRNIANWSLSKTPYDSPFNENDLIYRDTGIGFKGELFDKRINYFFMIGTGFGGNKFLNSPQVKKGDISVNNLGNGFYGARLEFYPWDNFIRIGGHYNLNYHKNVYLTEDKKNPINFFRQSYSTEIAFILPYETNLGNFSIPIGLRLNFVYAGGKVEDHILSDKKNPVDYIYNGYEISSIFEILKECLEFGIKFENYSDSKYDINKKTNNDSSQNYLTIGSTYFVNKNLKCQLNYVYNINSSFDNPGYKGNTLYSVVIFKF